MVSDRKGVVAALVEKAQEGDTAAAALLFSRTLPPMRPMSDSPEVPLSGSTLDERAEAVTSAALSGQISPTGATELMGLLTQQARIHEVSELAERLERIENALKLEGKTK